MITNLELATEEETYRWYTRPCVTPLRVKVIEDFIGNDMQIYDVAKNNHCSYGFVCQVIREYCGGVERCLTIPSRV